jgi:uncharacterized protein YoxC
MIENAIAQFGILGIIVIGCGYGILHASRYIAKKCLEPLVKKHLELLDVAIESLKNFGNSLSTLNEKVDDIHTKINEKYK